MSNGWGGCTLETCSVKDSIFQYRPSLAASALLIALYGVSAGVHLFQGIRWKAWTFMTLMICGCLSEMVGYGGRILMYNDPWGFNGFIMQIVCITIAPVFMTAAIYIMLYKTVCKLSLASARFRPQLYYQIFIPADIVSLVLQAIGGAKSSQSLGSSKAGVNIGLAGLCFQVVTLSVFIALSLDYAFRYRKDVRSGRVQGSALDRAFKVFLGFLSSAIVLILIRCAYRIYELSNGYQGEAIHNQGEFIGLESVMIILATFALNIGHPGPIFYGNKRKVTNLESPPAEEFRQTNEKL